MNAIRQLLALQLVTELSAAKVAQVVGYVMAVVVFVIATLKLVTLQRTEVELFFGMLVLAVFSSMICGATLVRIEAELRKRNDAEAGSAVPHDPHWFASNTQRRIGFRIARPLIPPPVKFHAKLRDVDELDSITPSEERVHVH